MRHNDWFSRLVAYVDSCETMAFKPGTHDCALFVAGAIESQTGVDLAKPWRGRYRTIAGGLKLINRAGYSDHVALVNAKFPKIEPAFASSGDICAVPVEDGLALGVVIGPHIRVLTPAGLGILPLTDAVMAWAGDSLELDT